MHWLFCRSYTTVILTVPFPVILGNPLFFSPVLTPLHLPLPCCPPSFWWNISSITLEEHQCLYSAFIIEKDILAGSRILCRIYFSLTILKSLFSCLSVWGMICFLSLRALRISLSLVLRNVTVLCLSVGLFFRYFT